MANIYEQIGETIRALRTTHNGTGINQEQLAEAIGSTPNTISRWESAKYRPSVQDLERLARFFGVSLTTFFPEIAPGAHVQALLSATSDLRKEDLDQVTQYALFCKARRQLKQRRNKPK